MSLERIGIVGGGAWGTALAQTVCKAGRPVRIWAYEQATVDDINTHHVNSQFLPGVNLDPSVTATSQLSDLADVDVLLLVTPAQNLRRVARDLAPSLAPGTPAVLCSKGIEQDSGLLMDAVLQHELPAAIPAVLSGPSFAADVANGLPTAVTLACADEALGETLARTLGHRAFRPYWTDDVPGAEIGGAVKNVLAIAAGIADGKALGASAHAALVTRGFSELIRIGRALGGRSETLHGLSGLGDLILTCASRQSRNMSLGHALGHGRTLDDILGERRSVSEGVFSAAAVARLGECHGIDLPICNAVHAIVSGRLTVDDAIDALLARPFRAEID